jgi:YD repeat-containing protein
MKLYDQFLALINKVKRVTNPYRQGETKYWTETKYDEANRVKEVLSPTADGQTAESKITTEYGISTVTNFVGTYTVGTDESGRRGRSITNALGQVVRVDEATANNDLGSLATPNQPTVYKYNPQGQMVQVTQGNQNRYFLYDNLGRLLKVRQPEQDVNTAFDEYDPITLNTGWTAKFTYDVLGNMLTATDAKGVVITNTYDNANRVKTRNYTLPQTQTPQNATAATPNVVYKYDGVGSAVTIPFAKGKLTESSNGISTTRYTAFDNLGRLLSSEQVTDGVVYPTSYKYNPISGGLVEEKYPSGRVVRNFFETDGDLSAISSRRNAINSFKTYASDFSYTASGVIEKLRIGNGRWESAKFNNRLQVTELALGTSATDTSLWKLNYEYGGLNQDGSVDATKNNGNIAKHIISFQGLSNPFVQSFKYDSLERLIEARETTNGSQNWIQTFGYDRYGNRISFAQTIGSQQLQINNITHPSIDPSTNRFTTGQGYTY